MQNQETYLRLVEVLFRQTDGVHWSTRSHLSFPSYHVLKVKTYASLEHLLESARIVSVQHDIRTVVRTFCWVISRENLLSTTLLCCAGREIVWL